MYRGLTECLSLQAECLNCHKAFFRGYAYSFIWYTECAKLFRGYIKGFGILYALYVIVNVLRDMKNVLKS